MYKYIIFSLVLASCNTSEIVKNVDPTNTPVVFIHGIMGSKLVNSEGSLQWLGASHALNISNPDLSLPIQWHNNIQAKDNLHADGVVLEVSTAFGLIGQQVYGPWITAAKQFKNKSFYVFSYDWRRDNNESTDLFVSYLKKIQQKHVGKKIQVIAHSMGGMITLAALNEHPLLFKQVVFVGVPFRGGIGYLDNLFLGTPIALNKSIISPKVIFTHASVYSFYPTDQYFENKNLSLDEARKPIKINWYDLAEWKSKGFGIYSKPNFKKFKKTPAEIEFLKTSLERGRKFRLRMKPSHQSYPPVLVISSKIHPTLDKVQRIKSKQMDEVPDWNFNSLPKVAGDGSVTYQDSLPPKPIKYSIQLTDYKHSYLLNDQKIQTKISKFLSEN